MKCGNVQALIVEYAEGALGPADEMCIDIHLIQCEECRDELAGLQNLLGTMAREIRACDAADDPVGFLDRFHALAPDSPTPSPVPSLVPFPSPVLRFALAAVVVASALSSGLIGHRGPASFRVFGATVAEACTDELSNAQLSPYLRNGLNLADLNKMGFVGHRGSDGASGD